MNKLWGEDSKRGKVMICVLEPGNLHKLQNREPIDIDLNDGPWKNGIPPKVHVIITYSETPIADAKSFSKLHPEMTVEDRRTPVSEKKRPHCPECKSTIETLGVWRSDDAPLWLAFCYTCGCVMGVSEPVSVLQREEQK